MTALLLFDGNQNVKRMTQRGGMELARGCVVLIRQRFNQFAQTCDPTSLTRESRQGVALDRSIWVEAIRRVIDEGERSVESALSDMNASRASAASIYKDGCGDENVFVHI